MCLADSATLVLLLSIQRLLLGQCMAEVTQGLSLENNASDTSFGQGVTLSLQLYQ